MALQHLRSSTANKRPLPAGMSDGQLAINTNLASPGLFFKDSNGDLVKVGPVHVGTTAPNASPASGGQTGNTLGEQWLDTTGGTYVFKVWDGSAWRSESGTFVDVNGDVMTGALGIIAGTAGSPGLYISGDTNTGIYSPGADQLALSTNGTGRLFVDASGRVGINTSTPERSLGLWSATNDDGIQIRNTSSAASVNKNSRLQFVGTDTVGTAKGTANIYCLAADQDLVGAHLSFWTRGSDVNAERLRITSAGLVGVGTSSPARRLEAVETSSTGTGALRLRNDQASPLLDAGVWGSAAATYGGITANSAFLQATNANLAFQTEGGAFPIIFATNASERARIDSSGRLLVGTSSDSGGALLQVNGDRVRIATAKTPASATDTGTAGEVCWDANYVYVCTATNTWKRSALSTW